MISFSYSATAANSKLIFAIDLIRHGDRTSIYEFPMAMHTWNEGLGQLTATGMRQEYELGLKLNKRYKVDHSLLPNNYQANTIYIRSTDYDRTIMSAASLLMGLYPLGTGPNLSNSTQALPSNYQPIPIHTIPTAQDSMFLIDMNSSETSALLEKYVYTRADWNDKSAQLAPKYTHWNQLTGLDIKTLRDVIIIGDTLTTYLAHNIPLPEGLSKKEAQTIIDADRWVQATMFKPHQVGDVIGSPSLKIIIAYIRQAAEKKTKTKFVLLSAHDSTLLAVMSALHTPLEASPPYASDLNFSLYESEPNHYFVTVTYNDQPIAIPGCNGSVCELERFLQLNSHLRHGVLQKG